MVDKSVPYIKAIMINRTAESYPRISLPDGFKICGYTDSYKETWLELAVEQHGLELSSAVEIFEREFLSKPELLSERCLFVVDEKSGKAVATASFWRGEIAPGISMNRIHWVATKAEYQGRGIGKRIIETLEQDEFFLRARRIEILSYVRSHYRTASLSELSERLYLTVPYLSRITTELFGKSFKELVVDERMSRAKTAFETSKLAIGDIIRSVGYENESYFHREFKKRFGSTPLAMRKSFKPASAI